MAASSGRCFSTRIQGHGRGFPWLLAVVLALAAAPSGCRAIAHFGQTDGSAGDGGAWDVPRPLDHRPLDLVRGFDHPLGDGRWVDAGPADGAIGEMRADGPAFDAGLPPDGAQDGSNPDFGFDGILVDAMPVDAMPVDVAQTRCAPFAVGFVGASDFVSVRAVAVIPPSTADAVAPSARYALLGTFRGTFPYSCGQKQAAWAPDKNIFLAALDDQGACLWIRTLGNTADDYAHALAVNGAGEIAVAGQLGTPGGSLDAVTLDRAAASPFPAENVGFVALYDRKGTPLWSFRVDSTGFGAQVESLAFGAGAYDDLLFFGASYEGTATLAVGDGLAFGPTDYRVETRVSFGAIALSRAAGAGQGGGPPIVPSELIPYRVYVEGTVPTAGVRTPRVAFDRKTAAMVMGMTQQGRATVAIYRQDTPLRGFDLAGGGGRSIAVVALDLKKPETIHPHYESPAAGNAELSALVVDRAGGIFVLGRYDSGFQMQIGAINLDLALPPPLKRSDGLVFKLAAGTALTPVWAKAIPTQGDDRPHDLTLDGRGALLSTGAFGEVGADQRSEVPRARIYEHQTTDGTRTRRNAFANGTPGKPLPAAGHGIAFDANSGAHGAELLVGEFTGPGPLNLGATGLVINGKLGETHGFFLRRCR